MIQMPNIVLSCENAQEFREAWTLLNAQLQPTNALEQLLLDKLVQVIWEQRRLHQIDTIRLDMALVDPNLESGFKNLEGDARTTKAFIELQKEDNATETALERRLRRLQREFHCLLAEYHHLHDSPKPPLQNEPKLLPPP